MEKPGPGARATTNWDGRGKIMLKEPVSDFEVQMHSELKDRVEIPSRYEFLKAHNGIRPNCLHGMIGTTGCGKSTLLKCIIAETAQHKKVLVWLRS